jgi:hypothetical protein
VLATEIASPNTMLAAQLQPNARVTTAPTAVTSTIRPTDPGIATRFTAQSCSRWKWSPTPNIRRITPSSAICSARWRSATKPGV